jgi:hypothetical protein
MRMRPPREGRRTSEIGLETPIFNGASDFPS